MPLAQLPIANGFYESDSLPISAQECTNWFPVTEEAPALAQETLRGTPGLSKVVDAGEAVNRGAGVMNGKPYFVNGDKLYRLNADDTVADMGAIAGTERVTMATNGTQLMILVNGGAGYVLTEGAAAVVAISDTDFIANGAPQAVVFLDGYFVCTTSNNKFIVSALNNALAWNAADFGSAESSPDDAVVPFVFKNQLFIGGTQTFEAFNNIGGASFPFQRTGLFLDQGAASPFAVTDAPNTFVFLGQGASDSPAVWGVDGNTARKLSTRAVDNIIQQYSTAQLSTVVAWSYGQGGAYFAGFNLPDTTIVYDFSTGKWHERKSRLLAGNYWRDTVWRASSLVSAYGEIYAADIQDGRIGKLSLDTYKEYDNNIVRRFSTQPFQNNMQPFSVPMLEMTLESGVGNANAADPKIVMDRSRDGGHTFEQERHRPLGKMGEYHRRAVWWRNGQASRFETFRFTLTDPVKPVGIQLTADIAGV